MHIVLIEIQYGVFFTVNACDVLCTTYMVLGWSCDRLHSSTLPYVSLF
jgi:hypothetical protein